MYCTREFTSWTLWNAARSRPCGPSPNCESLSMKDTFACVEIRMHSKVQHYDNPLGIVDIAQAASLPYHHWIFFSRKFWVLSGCGRYGLPSSRFSIWQCKQNKTKQKIIRYFLRSTFELTCLWVKGIFFCWTRMLGSLTCQQLKEFESCKNMWERFFFVWVRKIDFSARWWQQQKVTRRYGQKETWLSHIEASRD